MIPEKIKELMQKLLDNNFEAYIIGGAIRDLKLGNEPHDWDLFTNATGEEILKVFPNGNVIGGEERQEKILTVIVNDVEISQYRKNGNRTETGTSLFDHQATCDFTINSIAMDIEGKVIDSQEGLWDMRNRRLIFVGNPLDRIKEDPLRILRGIRLWNLFGCFENLQIVLDNINLLDTIPKERIKDELLKIISYPQGFDNLWCDGILYKIFPEFEKCRNMKGGKYHDEKVDRHILNVFSEASKITDNPLLRLAIMLHDIGKGETQSIDETGIHFYEHEKVGADIVEKRMTELKFSKDELKFVKTIVKNHLFSYIENPGKKTYIKLFNELDEAKVDIMDFMVMLYSDYQGNLAKPRIKFADFLKENVILKKYYEIKYSEEPMTVKDLKISGYDVMKYGIKGKDIGNVLDRQFQLVMDGEIKNERAGLLYSLKKQLE